MIHKVVIQILILDKKHEAKYAVMDTLHLTNTSGTQERLIKKTLIASAIFISLAAIAFAPKFHHALAVIALVCCIAFVIHTLLKQSKVSYTLTSTHFQQHLHKGGWAVKWNNISSIGICSYQQQGWHQPLPYIGIKLKHYSPFLDATCPRVASDILMSQRALLYLGMKQANPNTAFEDIVLDSSLFKSSNGKVYSGLLAMMANRMKHQRGFFDFDVFISAADLDREPAEFVGLARRYLAAAEPEETLD